MYGIGDLLNENTENVQKIQGKKEKQIENVNVETQIDLICSTSILIYNLYKSQ